MSKTKSVKKANARSEKEICRSNICYENVVPAWVFDKIDRNGKFAFDIRRKDFCHAVFLEKMISYSSLSWAQLQKQTHDNGKSKNHYLNVESLSKEAQDRLRIMHLEDAADHIYSIALQNKLRIVGLRDKDRFHVLWYDPEHEVCPAAKKHT